MEAVDDRLAQPARTAPGLAGPAPPAVDARQARRAPGLKLVPLAALLVLWAVIFCAGGAFEGGPGGKAFGADYAIFVAAGQVMKDGGNPYDKDLLFRTEKELLQQQHLPILDRRPRWRVGNPPLFFWLLEPLAGLPFQPAALCWISFILACSAGSSWLWLRHVGWRWSGAGTVGFLLMPQIVLATYYGNVVGIVFAGLVGGAVAAQHRPFVAGALLGLAWLKPQVGLPAAFLITVFHTHSWRRTLAGFGGASLGFFGLSALIGGPGLFASWLAGLLGWSHDAVVQPNMASLSGLYVYWAPVPLRLGLQATSLAAALALTAICLRKPHGAGPAQLGVAGWLWAAWFLATPFSHFSDEMVLALPLASLLVAGGASSRWAAASLYVLYFSLFLVNWSPLSVSFIPLAVILVGVCLWQAGSKTSAVASAYR